MTTRITVLLVEDDAAMREFLEEELVEAGYHVMATAGVEEALERLAREPVDLIITDLMMPGRTGRELLDEVRVREPEIPVIIITAFGSIDSAVQAMRSGAFHFLSKPFKPEELLAVMDEALRHRRLKSELASPAGRMNAGTGSIVACDHLMRKTLELVRRAAPADTPVLLVGETGTGKELLARMLHAENPNRPGPFLAVNCSAIPESLLESQLFGHRRGSFTDAREDRPGLFQLAQGGTVFLDEIGDMPLPLQAKLLRVLQEKEVHPLGATTPVPIDVRVVAATHHDIALAVQESRFRQDLYYRLNVIVIQVPPLRERPDDLLPLIQHFLEQHGPRLGRPGCTLSPEALIVLRNHSWPGNVRELENCIQRALVLGRGDTIGVADLPEGVRAARPIEHPTALPRPVAEVEREHILRTLRSVGGNKASAARLLGLDRKTLYRKLQQYKIDP